MIVQHGFSRHNLFCEKALLSTVFGMVRPHLLSLIRLHNILRFNTQHYFNFLFSFFPPSDDRRLMCVRSAACRVTLRRTSTAWRPSRMCGKFLPNHRSSSELESTISLFSSFWGTFEALCHFSVNEFEKFICEGKERGIGRGWQTSLKWNEAAEKLLSSLCASKLPKLKLPFLSVSHSMR